MAKPKIPIGVKQNVVSLLNKGVVVEYDTITNFPRVCDRLRDMNPNIDEGIINRIIRVGEDSIQHYNYIYRLIRDLGGEPQFNFQTLSRMPDTHDFLLKQLDKERAAESIYREAARIIGDPSKNESARILNQIATDEGNHVIVLEHVISGLNI